MASDLPDDPAAGERRRLATARELSLRGELVQIRHELSLLLEELDRVAAHASEPRIQSAVVTAVVPKTVLLHIGVPPIRRS